MKLFAKKLRYFSIAAAGFLVMISFQNCGRPADFQNTENSSLIENLSTLNFDLDYAGAGLVGQPLEMWVKNPMVSGNSTDLNALKLEENMHVLWSIRPAENPDSKPKIMNGNPGIINRDANSQLAAGVYLITVKVDMDGVTSSKDFSIVMNDVGRACLSPEKSFVLNGPSQVGLNKGLPASVEYSVSDLNSSSRAQECYLIEKESITWSLGIGKSMLVELGVGNPYTIKFNQAGDYSLNVQFSYFDTIFDRPARQTFSLSKLISVEDLIFLCNRIEAPEFNPYFSLPVGKISIGETVNLSAQFSVCMRQQLETTKWFVDGVEVDLKMAGPTTTISVLTNRAGNISISMDYTLSNGDKGSVEGSFIVQEP